MKANVTQSAFGKTPAGRRVHLYTLTNARGLTARITNYGTIITELCVPDRRGRLGNVVLGFDNLKQYRDGHPYFGCTAGRVANRIAKGRFKLDGKSYQLAVNNGPNHLHGGIGGFDKVVWSAEILAGREAAVKFSHTSPHGDEGYPGNLAVVVVMALTDANELRIDYLAATDRATPVNLTNHSYFNLAGGGNILGHELKLAADHYTPVDATSIPTGKIAPVAGTPMDFTRSRPIGARFGELDGKPRGYDHNFVLNSGGGKLAPCATVYERATGRVMEVLTTQPGVQFYTGNWLDGTWRGPDGIYYTQHSGFCLESQHFPDAINQAKFPSILLRPGRTYLQTTIHRFSTRS